MNFYIFTILIFLISNQIVNGKKKEEEKEWATNLNDETFTQFIESNKHVLVMFHQPYCIHCVKLLPIINEAAKILTNKPTITEVPVKIAIVDISKAQDIASKFQIGHTPDLKFIRDNHVYAYEGPKDSGKSMVKFLKTEAVINWTPPKVHVDELTSNNFDEWISQHELALVEFYTPDCVHCQRLKPQFEGAAKELSKIDSIRLGRVDCSKEESFKKRFNLEGYPTLKVIRNGKRTHGYTGQPETQNIVNFMKKSLEPSKEIENFSEFKRKATNPTDHYIIGVFNDTEEELYKIFDQFSIKYPEDFRIFHTFQPSKFLESVKIKNLKVPAVIVYYHDYIVSRKESNFRVFDGETNSTLEDLENFIMKKSLPLVGVMTTENRKHIYKNPRPICLGIYQVDFEIELLKTTLYFRDKLVAVAKKNPEITFAIVDENKNENLIKVFNLQEAKGDVTLVCFNDKSQKFIYDNEDSFEEDEIEEFVNKFIKNELKPNFMSETEPKNNAKKLIKTFVGSTISSILENNPSKDIIVFFYSKNQWEKCADFDKLYTDLAKTYAKNKNMIFGTLNIDFNEFPAIFEIPSIPAMFIRKANEVETFKFEYNENSNLNDLVSFIENPEKKQESSTVKEEL